MDIHILPEIEKLPSVLQLRALEDEISAHKQTITNLQQEIAASKVVTSRILTSRKKTGNYDRKLKSYVLIPLV